MPIYAYRCTTCGHAKDVLQKISDPLLTDCPACGAATFVKQVTAAGFQLKGSGWYVTDFRGGNTAAGKPEAGEPGASDPAAKPAEKAADKSEDKSAKPTQPAEGGGDKAASPAPAAAPAPSPAPAAPTKPASPPPPATGG